MSCSKLGCAVSLVIAAFCGIVCAESQLPAPQPPAPNLIAKQGNAEVVVLDVDAHLATMPKADRSGFIDSPKRIEQLLSHILMRRNLAIEARELGLDKDPIVQQELLQATETVLMRHRLDYIREHAEIPDLTQLAKEKYLANRADYKSPETVTVAHILLDAKSRTDEEAKAQLQKWKVEIRDGKSTIETIAAEHSDDPGAKSNNGIYENVSADTFVVAFADAVRGLQNPGDLSELVKTEFGYHLIQLKSRNPSKTYNFEEIETQLVAAEREKFIRQVQSAHIEALKALPIEASESSVAPLRTRYGKPKLKVETGSTEAADADVIAPGAESAEKATEAPAPGAEPST